MRIPPCFQVVGVLVIAAFLFGCSTSNSSGSGDPSGSSPQISGISPTSGSTAGGTTVTISGNNLQSGAAVTFGGISATVVNVASSSQATVTTPAHSAGSVDVVVTNPGGKSATLSNGFGYGTAPSVSAISPNTGSIAGGTTVNIAGSKFAAGALVFFGAVAATGITVTSPTQIQATTPAISAPAAVNVVVQNPDGGSGTLANGFTYTSAAPTSAPTVSAVSPGTASPASTVDISGTNFGSGAAVTIGSTAASNVQFMSSTELTATVPNVSPGTYDVTVANKNGLSATLSSGLTVAPPTSLLAGCTVSASNQPVCGSNDGSAAIPSGWTLVLAEGFDTHALATSYESLSGTTIECSVWHSGTCAMEGDYSGSGNVRFLDIKGAMTGSHELYVSWWEYSPGMNANFNANNFLVKLLDTSANGTNTFDRWTFSNGWSGNGTCLNGIGPGNDYDCQNGEAVVESQEPGQSGMVQYGNYINFPVSGWHQYEIHYLANTFTNGTADSDGSIQLYVDGQLELSHSNIVVNYTDMTAMEIQLGGDFEDAKYTDSTGTECIIPSMQDTWSYCSPVFSTCSPCPIPPNFTRYWDDIIVLKK